MDADFGTLKPLTFGSSSTRGGAIPLSAVDTPNREGHQTAVVDADRHVAVVLGGEVAVHLVLVRAPVVGVLAPLPGLQVGCLNQAPWNKFLHQHTAAWCEPHIADHEEASFFTLMHTGAELLLLWVWCGW